MSWPGKPGSVDWKENLLGRHAHAFATPVPQVQSGLAYVRIRSTRSRKEEHRGRAPKSSFQPPHTSGLLDPVGNLEFSDRSNRFTAVASERQNT